MDDTKILDAGYKAAQPGAVTMHKPDWSSLMSDLHRSLTRAEESLRLIHMNPEHRHFAKGHLMVARATLKLLEDWC